MTRNEAGEVRVCETRLLGGDVRPRGDVARDEVRDVLLGWLRVIGGRTSLAILVNHSANLESPYQRRKRTKSFEASSIVIAYTDGHSDHWSLTKHQYYRNVAKTLKVFNTVQNLPLNPLRSRQLPLRLLLPSLDRQPFHLQPLHTFNYALDVDLQRNFAAKCGAL